MKQNIGILLIVLGVIALLASYIQKGYLVDCNWWNVTALVLIIVGIVAHILITKRS